MTALRRLSLYLHTLRWLRVSQLFFQVYRRVRPSIEPAQVDAEPLRGSLLSAPCAVVPQPDRYEFRFLNRGRPADPAVIDWHPADESRLWRYNLHYFDFLLWKSFPDDDKSAYIENWIEANPVGTVDAWEPYTVSLRIVNWAKHFATIADDIPGHWAHSLLNQAVWLETNLEHHVLANHLLKNAKALIFAGAMFAGGNANRLLRKGLDLALREVSEQILPDGGHYERSPMYHCIVLEDLLDLVNLFGANPALVTEIQLNKLTDAATQALRFLDAILGADGRIPLFNDSAYAIAPEPDELFAYGQRLFDFHRVHTGSKPVHVRLPATGYFGYRHSGDSFLVDCGPVGPDYQPGHAHCDTLSYVLCMDGQQVVVDSGVRGYDGDSLRGYARGTEAHNTVCVSGREQSEVWGTFRVARRARARLREFSEFRDDRLSFTGSHDGYRRLPERVEHIRSVVADLAGRWQVCDRLEGRGAVRAESFVHLHPDVEPIERGEGRIELTRSGAVFATLRVPESAEISIVNGHYCPEFGVAVENRVIAIRGAGELPFGIEYEISRSGRAALTDPAPAKTLT